MNLLAETSDAAVQELMRKGTASRYEFGPLFAAIGFVTLLLLIWALFFRKRKDESSRRYSYHRAREAKDAAARPPAPPALQKKRRKKRHRHRRRNPTLAETGGLPPVRTEPFAGDPP